MHLTAELSKGIKMNAEQLIRFAAGPARLIFNAAGCIHRPIVHFCRENGSHGVTTIPVVIENKDEMMGFAKAVLRAEQAMAYVLISEAWMLDVTDTPADIKKLVAECNEKGLKDNPARKEIVGLTAEDQDGAAVQGYMPITRTVVSSTPSLGELVVVPRVEGETVEGRFIGLLPKRQGQRVQ